MAVASTPYRWRIEEFLRAWEAGVFDSRVELVDGEVWPVPIGTWHGDTAARLMRALPNDDHRVTTASLPTGDSLPDPDCWVRVASAQPAGRLSERLLAWSPADVVLVIEVADETVDQDLGPKALLYARAGYGCYWAVTRDGIYEHCDATEAGYLTRRLHRRGERLTVRYAGVDIAVDDLLAPT